MNDSIRAILQSILDTHWGEKCLFWEGAVLTANETYDVIVVSGALEKNDPLTVLNTLKAHLAENGKLFLWCDNRLGLKYFIGEKDPHTKRYGDGLENYINTANCQKRSYSLSEMKAFIQKAGFCSIQVYSVFPNLTAPKFIISEDYTPGELMSIRLQPEYASPDTLFMNEEYILDAVIRNGMLPQMADGLLFEVSDAEISGDVAEIILSDNRSRENAMVTVIRSNQTVEKKSLYPEGAQKLYTLEQNHNRLNEHGVKTVPGKIVMADETVPIYQMPQIDAPLANQYLQELFFSDKGQFIREMDRFREQILKSSEIVEENGHILRQAYPDMVPLNCFVRDSEYIFFDQEFCFENYPADAIITRAIQIVYELDQRMEQTLPRKFFFDRYGLMENLNGWFALSRKFTDDLVFPCVEAQKKRPQVYRNRARLNYPEDLYAQLMYNPVAGLENKEIILYGICETTNKFIEMYQRDYTIKAILSDQPEAAVVSYREYPVLDFHTVRPSDIEPCRVIICCPFCEEIRCKLLKKGANDIAVYDPEKVYPGRQACRLSYEKTPEHKKYHIGYVAGVFDLYHIGHLNLFKRAKEQCDYLIVGVVTDAGVRDFKKTEPFIPFEERSEMVRSCRYVDEVVEIPYFYRGTQEAFQKYHFDAQFSGSDYEKTPLWLGHKQWLENHGAELVFLPYTTQTSSTRIKELISKNLI